MSSAWLELGIGCEANFRGFLCTPIPVSREQNLPLQALMLKITQWLDRAPREIPTALHAACCVREGIYSRSRVTEELLAWATDPKRLEKLSPPLRNALEQVALHGERGISLARLEQELGEDSDALNLGEVLRDGLWCAVERHDDTLWLRIFADHFEPLLHARLGKLTPPESPTPLAISLHQRFLQGMAGVCARLRLGKVRSNRDGSLNRRDQQNLADAFEGLGILGEDARLDALRLGLALLANREGLRASQGRLDLAVDPTEFLEELPQLSLDWWNKHHTQEQTLLLLWQERWMDGQEAARWLGGLRPASEAHWRQLPQALRLGILCGKLEASMREDVLVAVHHHSPANPPPDTSRITPDLKLLLPPGASLSDWYRAHLLGNLESCELYARFRLERESWLGGIAVAGSDTAWAWTETLQPSDNVRQTLSTWTEARTLCVLRNVSVLQVRDPRRQRELASLPQMAPFIREEIPGWGFVLDSHRETELRELLSRLGYEPPPLRDEELSWQSISSRPGLDLPLLVGHTHGDDPVWPRPESPDTPGKSGTKTRFSGELRELGIAELTQLLDYSVVVDAPLELTIKGAPKRILKLWPEKVDKRKSPIVLKARNADGAAREIPIDTIKQIRLIEE